VVELGRPEMTIRVKHVLIACWIPKATDTHTVCVILTNFPPQHLFAERVSALRYTHPACLLIIHGAKHKKLDTTQTTFG
jgi:hypothetical protein